MQQAERSTITQPVPTTPAERRLSYMRDFTAQILIAILAAGVVVATVVLRLNGKGDEALVPDMSNFLTICITSIAGSYAIKSASSR